MREIKFRAWEGKGMLDHERCVENRYSPTWKGNLAWMQFTGLHDKNGKEIYEGDIVVHRKLGSEIDYATFGIFETTEGHNPRVVKYEAYGFSPIAGWIEDVHEGLQWEVIGNIYENPELLQSDEARSTTKATTPQ